jgi:hypothetical protein
MTKIATFTAGSTEDLVAPTSTGVAVDSSYSDPRGNTTCDFDGPQVVDVVSVEAVSDDGPLESVRFYYSSADGTWVAGPFPVARVGRECGDPFHLYFDIGIASDRFNVRAVDLAGNVEAVAHELDGMSCEEGRASEAGGCSAGRGHGLLALLVVLGLGGSRGRHRGRGAITRAAPRS